MSEQCTICERNPCVAYCSKQQFPASSEQGASSETRVYASCTLCGEAMWKFTGAESSVWIHSSTSSSLCSKPTTDPTGYKMKPVEPLPAPSAPAGCETIALGFAPQRVENHAVGIIRFHGSNDGKTLVIEKAKPVTVPPSAPEPEYMQPDDLCSCTHTLEHHDPDGCTRKDKGCDCKRFMRAVVPPSAEGVVSERTNLNPDQAAELLEAIHKDVQGKIHDEWDWIKASFLTECLRCMANDSQTSLTATQEERDAYRTALIQAGRNVGAFLTDEVSLQFLMGVPDEALAVVTKLKAEVATLKAQLASRQTPTTLP